MQVGAVTTTIEVSSSAPPVENSTMTVGQVINRQSLSLKRSIARWFVRRTTGLGTPDEDTLRYHAEPVDLIGTRNVARTCDVRRVLEDTSRVAKDIHTRVAGDHAPPIKFGRRLQRQNHAIEAGLGHEFTASWPRFRPD